MRFLRLVLRRALVRAAPPRAVLVAGVALVAACGSNPVVTPVATPTAGTATTALVPPTTPAGSSAAPAPSPTAPSGFAFDPESIVGYFQSIGYTCVDRRRSTTASGFEFQACQLADADGRTRTFGVVTDPDDAVADAFLTVRGTDAETVLDPAAVIEPFARFLGAFLGEEQGSALLPWVAAHLGDVDARTAFGPLTVATYTASADDHSTLTVEIATQAYLDAPAPASLPPASGPTPS